MIAPFLLISSTILFLSIDWIVSKKGDKGSTELGNGERVKKFSKRVTY